MKLKDLRDFVNSAEVRALPDDAPVGALGHFGEFCPALDAQLEICKTPKLLFGTRYGTTSAIILPAIDIGPDPD